MGKDKEIELPQLITLLRKTSFFKNLTDSQLRKLASICQIVCLKKNEFLFRQGDISDGFYILIDGRMVAILEQEVNNKLIGLIHTGETVGELGGFSNKPRALAVKAIFDSRLIWLNHKNIALFLDHIATPDIFTNIVATIITRSQSLIKHLGAEKQNRHCALIPATTKNIPERFIQSLKQYLVDEHRIVIVEQALVDENSGAKLLSKLKSLIIKAAQEDKTLLFVISSLEQLNVYMGYYLQQKGLDILYQLDAIYAVTEAKTDGKISRSVTTLFDNTFLPFVQHKELILWHEDGQERPSQTNYWLSQASFRMHHHIRDRKEDFLRLFRFILGKANALVLGGGGVRGWSSLGVVKALTEHGIGIDAICGSSSGSFLSSAYACTLDINKALSMGKPLINVMGVFKLRQLTYPIISINNGYKLTKSLKEIFSSLNIEDLWLFNFSVASNLNTHREVIQRIGPLWEAVRSSGSLPIIFPPLVREGEMLIDGSLLNNLPVDQMKSIIGNGHFIIAVSLSNFQTGEQYDFPPVVGFWQALKNRLGLAKHPFSYPSFTESMLNSLMLGSSHRDLENANRANLLIDYNLKDVPLTYYPPDKIPSLIERGYQETLPYLKNIKVAHQTGIIQT